MSQGAAKQLSFRERRAQFSTRILANGRINVLPKSAIQAEIEKTDLRQILTTLFQQKSALIQARLKHPQGSEEWNRITETLNRVAGALGHCQKMLAEAKSREFCEVFAFCAQQLLTHEAFLMIQQATHELMGKPYKPTNVG